MGSMHGPIGPGLKPWTCIHVCMYVHFMNVRDQNELAREREGGGGEREEEEEGGGGTKKQKRAPPPPSEPAAQRQPRY